ncbi:MAG: cytochrome C oxidase subunit IV family protein [Prolixibacteraceae bacterium]
MEHAKHHIVPYRTYAIILVLLLFLTFISVAITSIELGSYTVAGALILATIKSSLVLTYFMHLKFDEPYIRIMVAFVFVLFAAVLIITLIDYITI